MYTSNNRPIGVSDVIDATTRLSTTKTPSNGNGGGKSNGNGNGSGNQFWGMPKTPTHPDLTGARCEPKAKEPTPNKPAPNEPAPKKPVDKAPEPHKPAPKKPVDKKPEPHKPEPKKPVMKEPVDKGRDKPGYKPAPKGGDDKPGYETPGYKPAPKGGDDKPGYKNPGYKPGDGYQPKNPGKPGGGGDKPTDPTDPTDPVTPTESISEIAAGSDDFNLLSRALETAGLTTALSDPNADLTVFAPTDAAFTNLAVELGFTGDTTDENAVFQSLVGSLTDLGGGDPLPVLTDILNYHVSPGAKTADEIANAQSIDTLLTGATITPTAGALGDLDPDADDPQITTNDIGATNGVVQVIDEVLRPIDIQTDMTGPGVSLALLPDGLQPSGDLGIADNVGNSVRVEYDDNGAISTIVTGRTQNEGPTEFSSATFNFDGDANLLSAQSSIAQGQRPEGPEPSGEAIEFVGDQPQRPVLDANNELIGFADDGFANDDGKAVVVTLDNNGDINGFEVREFSQIDGVPFTDVRIRIFALDGTLIAEAQS